MNLLPDNEPTASEAVRPLAVPAKLTPRERRRLDTASRVDLGVYGELGRTYRRAIEGIIADRAQAKERMS